MGESSLERRPVFSDESQSFYVPEDHVQLHPVFEGLCTGWSWALFLANGAVAFPVSGELRNPLVRFGIDCPLIWGISMASLVLTRITSPLWGLLRLLSNKLAIRSQRGLRKMTYTPHLASG